MPVLEDCLPGLSELMHPPSVLGTAALTAFAYQGHDLDQMLDRIAERHKGPTASPAQEYDISIAYQLGFRRADGLAHLKSALSRNMLFRVGDGSGTIAPLRLLAIMAPGDLMTNTPLDFFTNHLNVRLDLLYLLPNEPLPKLIPDHDVAFFAIGEASPEMLARLRALYAAWPRPALNDPAFLRAMQRDRLSRSLSGVPGICSPPTAAVNRATLEAGMEPEAWGISYPCLIRPQGSHAGAGLALLENTQHLAAYLRRTAERSFYLSNFQDYRDADGRYRKYRVAFVGRRPVLCHMAISNQWMIHYLNAGMTESAEKRDQEARAMATFDTGFAQRHAAAFDALHQRLGLDVYSIDCSETQDGRLLVFEADTAAIIHMMDPPDLFPYKQPQMRRVFAAFEDLVRGRALG